MKRSQPNRDWSKARAKVDDEACCRICLNPNGTQAAHIAGRRFDVPEPGQKKIVVKADSIIPLCPDCHTLFDAHRLDVLPYLNRDEEIQVVADMGLENARIRTAPLAYQSKVAA